MKKNLFKKINLIFILTLIFIFINSINILAVETSEVYLKWQQLSDEEKENSIMPNPFVNTIKTTYDENSIFNRFTKSIGDNLENGYDLRENNNNIKIKLKDQQTTDECWAFTTTTMIETNVNKTLKRDLELSPRHIDYATSRTFLDGTNKNGYKREIGMGNFYISLSYCASGNGPVLEKDMPFENNRNKVNLNSISKPTALKVEDYVEFPIIHKTYTNSGIIYTNGGVSGSKYTTTQVRDIRNSVKEHIKKYGAVSAYMYVGKDITSNDAVYINNNKVSQGIVNTYAYFNKDSNKVYNHGVSIIGWDDNYSRNNFNENCKPSSDGAYIVLNSASLNGKYSIMYVSYEDTWIEFGNFGVVRTDDVKYDNIYQHDIYGYSYALPLENDGEVINTVYISNVFQRDASKTEYLNEVSIYVPSEQNVEIYINSSDGDNTKIKKVVSAGILKPGFHTIELPKPEKLTGNKFVIAAKITDNSGIEVAMETNYLSNGGDSNFWDYATSKSGESFVSADGNEWQDFTTIIRDSNVCLKAFTSYGEGTIQKGDVNADGVITVKDLVIVNRAIIGKITLTQKQKEYADMNEDGVITIKDLVRINKIILGK